MKKLTFLLIIALMISCENKENTLEIGLSEKEGPGPFRLYQKVIHPIDKQPEINGIPSVYKEYVIRKLDLQPPQAAWQRYKDDDITKKRMFKILNKFNADSTLLTESFVDQNILFLIGTTYSEKRAITVDSDNDESFKGEKILYFPYPVNKIKNRKHILDTLSQQKAQYEYYDGNSIIDKTFTFKSLPFYLSKYYSTNYKDSLENKYHLIVTRYAHLKGTFNIKNQKYKIAINLSHLPFFIPAINYFYITKKGESFPHYKTHPAIKIGDTINLNNTDVCLTNINILDNKASLEILGTNKDSTGIVQGYYMPNIKTKTINGKIFNLNDYKGNYILLDFWGTWCKPCVKSIPELRQLKSKFKKQNFNIVSIAIDTDKEKVSKFIKKHNMNWIHLFEKQGTDKLTKKMKVSEFPTTILIGKNGKIIARNKSIKEIEKLLNNRLHE